MTIARNRQLSFEVAPKIITIECDTYPRHNICLAFLPPFSYFGIDLFPHFTLDFTCVTWNNIQYTWVLHTVKQLCTLKQTCFHYQAQLAYPTCPCQLLVHFLVNFYAPWTLDHGGEQGEKATLRIDTVRVNSIIWLLKKRILNINLLMLQAWFLPKLQIKNLKESSPHLFFSFILLNHVLKIHRVTSLLINICKGLVFWFVRMNHCIVPWSFFWHLKWQLPVQKDEWTGR